MTEQEAMLRLAAMRAIEREATRECVMCCLRWILAVAVVCGIVVIASTAQAQVDAPNAHLWASVMLKNGGQGSGTIVTPEGLGVTCGHLFRGTIGGKFECYFADGKSCEATLLYHRLGGDQDIALFSIPKEEVRGYCPVADRVPDGDVRAVGYPQGVGPTLVPSAFVGDYPGRNKWQFQQYINNGQSGGGIFQGNYLVGVMVEKNAGQPGQPGTICTAVPLPVIVDALAQCGPGGCSPGNAAGGFLPRPNRPLGNPPIGGGQIPPAAPRDDLPGPAEEPLAPVTPKPTAPANSDRLDKIEKLLAEIAARKPEPGPKGDQGPAGERGPIGPSGPKGDAGTLDLSKLPPIQVEILGEHGEITYRQSVFLGGKPLQLQLVPRNPSSLSP
jgi:hypothetical protein